MDYKKLLQVILDIGEEMLVAGAEVRRVEDSVERMCAAYGCSERTNVFIIISNIQVTIETPNGEIITQIRRVVRSDVNYDRLDHLNNLSRLICDTKPNLAEIRKKFDVIMDRKPLSLNVMMLGQFIIAGDFAVFFGGDIWDGLASGIVGLVIFGCTKLLSKGNQRATNQMAKFFILSFIGGIVSVGFALIGLHVDKIMIGGIMLLIPGIPLTNSIRDLLLGDIATGLLRFFNSLLIALAIACGFGLALMIPGNDFAVLHMGDAIWFTDKFWTYPIQVIAATIGSLGFAINFNVKGRQLIHTTIAGGLTWILYLICASFINGYLLPNLIASTFAGIMAEILARKDRAPATIFLTIAAVPLIPGAALYYSMTGIVLSNRVDFVLFGQKCIIIALAISLGFVIVSVMTKYVRAAFNKIKTVSYI